MSCIVCSAGAMIKRQAFSLEEEMKAPLFSFLDTAVDLQEAFYAGKTDQTNLLARKMIQKIQKVREQSKKSLSYHQKAYMEKILQNLNTQLESFSAESFKNRSKNILAINRQTAYMAKTYGINNYNFFFCTKDRSLHLKKKHKYSKEVLKQDAEFCGKVLTK